MNYEDSIFSPFSVDLRFFRRFIRKFFPRFN